MKIGLLSTRGIPNRYGGFEEFVEQVESTGRIVAMKYLFIVKTM